MKRKITFLLMGSIISTFLLFSNFCWSQGYHQITHLSGTQNVNGVNVTVTSSGSTFNTQNCGAGPYWIGVYIFGGGSYRFAFSRPVSYVKLEITAIDSSEIISFSINGVPYTLTNSNLSTFPGTCGQQLATIVGGSLHAVGVSSPPASGGKIVISGSINDIEVTANGRRNGTVFSIYYGDIEALSNSPVCEGDSLLLYAVPEIDEASYTWEGPAGFRSSVPAPVIPEATQAYEGNYILKMITGSDTLIDSTYVTIMPRPITEIVYDEPICEGRDLQLSNTTTLSGVQYQWNGPNGFSATIPNPILLDVQYFQSGVYILTTTLGTCSYSTEAVINVFPPSHYSFTEVICPNEQYDFNGKLLHSSGIYSDTLIASNNCDSIVTLDLVVLPAPEINISIESYPKPLCMGDTVVCLATGAIRYQWINNEKLLGNSNREYIYLPYLSNNIFVIGTAINGCSDTLSIVINTSTCCEVFVPNALSPNSDGINDAFSVIPHGHIQSYRLEIFNRWGERVFTSYNINNHWDGTYKGKPADTGLYFYLLTAECLEGTKLQRKGDITLIR